MKLRDPKSLDENDGRQDGYISVDGDLVAVAEDGTFESERIDEQWARGYAERNGYDLSDVLVEESAEEPPADDESETCEAVMNSGDVCGRDLPCPYHTD